MSGICERLGAKFPGPTRQIPGATRLLFWTTADLEAKLIDFQHYYNGHRTHAGLEGRLPEPPAGGPVSPTGLSVRTGGGATVEACTKLR